MNATQLFTIGHSNRDLDEFIQILTVNEITAVADVRSSPYSRHFPQFCMIALRQALAAHHVDYVFLGEELGARRNEPGCYVDGIARYEKIAQMPSFIAGLARIRRGTMSHRIALMCSEKDPITCHRTILVCRQLKDEYDIYHLIGVNEIEAQYAAELRLLELIGLPRKSLFQTEQELIQEAYDKQGERIAYRLGSPEDSLTNNEE